MSKSLKFLVNFIFTIKKYFILCPYSSSGNLGSSNHKIARNKRKPLILPNHTQKAFASPAVYDDSQSSGHCLRTCILTEPALSVSLKSDVFLSRDLDCYKHRCPGSTTHHREEHHTNIRHLFRISFYPISKRPISIINQPFKINSLHTMTHLGNMSVFEMREKRINLYGFCST